MNYNKISNEENSPAEKIEKTVPETPVEKISEYGIVINCQALRVRVKPDFESKVLDTIEKGTTVEILTKSEEWYKITVNTLKGFVAADYIKLLDEVTNG